MSTSIKMISTVDPDKSVFITHENGWKSTKIYVNGKIVKELSAPSEIKTGVIFFLENFGRIEVKLNSVTFVISLTVNGELFEEEKTAFQISESMNGPIIIFAILAIINFFIFAFALIGSTNSFESSNRYDFIMLLLTGFYTLTYALSLIFLFRKVYFFYFIGTALYSLTSLYYCYLLSEEFNGISLFALGIRLLLMLVLLYHFKWALAFMRGNNAPKGENLIDLDL